MTTLLQRIEHRYYHKEMLEEPLPAQQNEITFQHSGREYHLHKGRSHFTIDGREKRLHRQRIWGMAHGGDVLFLSSAGKVYAVNPISAGIIKRFPDFINPKELHFNPETSTLLVRDRHQTISMCFKDSDAPSHVADETFSSRWLHRLRRTCYIAWDIFEEFKIEFKVGCQTFLKTRPLVIITGLLGVVSGLGTGMMGALAAEASAIKGTLLVAALAGSFFGGVLALASFCVLAITVTALALATFDTFRAY